MIRFREILWVGICLVGFGCAVGGGGEQWVIGDEVVRVMDRGLDFELRERAIDRVVDEDWTRGEKLLYRLVLEGGHDNRLRFKAIDLLVGRDAGRFEKMMGEGIVGVENLEVLEKLIGLAVELEWVSWRGGLVKRYAKRVQGVRDLDRVERKGLLGLSEGKEIEDVIWGVVKGKGRIGERVAGWELLCRLAGQEDADEYLGGRKIVAGYLRGVQDGDGQLLIDLKAGMEELGVVAMNREEVLWLMYLRMNGQRNYYERLRKLVGILSNGQREDLKLRHLGVLDWVGETVYKDTSRHLGLSISHDLGKRRHVLGGRIVGGVKGRHPQLLDNSSLSWGDMMSLSRLMGGLSDGDVVESLFLQAEADMKDKGGEHGGILKFVDGKFLAVGYRGKAGRDDRYVSSGALIRDLYMGGYHYHFHAQGYGNGRYAGPGDYDFRFAERIGGNCVVFTFVEVGVLNVDFYTGGGEVVDLGCLER